MSNKMKYKPIPPGKEYNGLRGLPTIARNNMGYAKMGTETSLLNKMSMGDSMDMVNMLEKRTYGGTPMNKKKMGGSNTYSGEY